MNTDDSNDAVESVEFTNSVSSSDCFIVCVDYVLLIDLVNDVKFCWFCWLR